MAERKILYVPILKSKAGERWALSGLHGPAKSKIRPVVEFHPHDTKALGDHMEGICEAFQAAWGVNRWFYADTIWLHGNYGSPAVIGEVFEASEAADLQTVPVVRTSYDDASLQQLQNVIVEGERGCMLRITPETLDTPALIDSVVEAVGVPRSQVDLLLDYRQHPMTLTVDIAKIPHVSEWRLFIAASGVFPKSLMHLPLHQWHPLPRHDWASWQAGIATTIRRKPIYADYTMRPPGPPADFGEPSVNLRYASEEHWLVQMGGKHKHGAAPEMHAMCSQLIARPEYSGVGFSTGDEEIDRVADEDEGPGGPTQWLQWCVSHHMEFVVQQLSPADV
jgi:hypothetical protein